MGLEVWGEWASVGLILATGFGLLYAKVKSIVTRIDGIVTQIDGLIDRLKEDHQERLRIWKRLDEHTVEVAKLGVRITEQGGSE